MVLPTKQRKAGLIAGKKFPKLRCSAKTCCPKTAKEIIETELKQEIFDCVLYPGDVLVIDSLSKRFNVSRTPVREALITLCNEKLLEVKPRYGFIVTQVEAKDIIETYSLRILLEKETVRMATQNMDSSELEHLMSLIDRPIYPYGRLFHSYIATCSGWGVLAEVLEHLMDRTARTRALFNNFQQKLPLRDSVGNGRSIHKNIYDAIAEQDEEKAVFLMEDHLSGSRDYILKALSASV